MEKLNELWLEYEATIKGVNYYDCDIRPVLEDDWENDLILISKNYGFIGWLVENNKVDLENLIIKKVEDRGGNKVIKDIKYYSEYESLLMLLSIQDNPIEFLISILK